MQYITCYLAQSLQRQIHCRISNTYSLENAFASAQHCYNKDLPTCRNRKQKLNGSTRPGIGPCLTRSPPKKKSAYAEHNVSEQSENPPAPTLQRELWKAALTPSTATWKYVRPSFPPLPYYPLTTHTVLFHEILTLHSAASIAQNLSFNGLYNNPSLFPAAFKYLHAGRARLTEDSVLAHVRWRLCRWPWWPAAWERAMLGVEGRDGMGVVVGGSLEALAWAVHEAGFRERAGRGEGGGCCHGETVGGEGCCGGLGGL